MDDLLYNAAIAYGTLKNKGYHIVLGRKTSTYSLDIRFPYDSFFHLAGLQHLKDITYNSTNKERIFKDICTKKIAYKTIQNSVFFEKAFIKERLCFLPRLEELLDNPTLVYRINLNKYQEYTQIKADYLTEYKLPERFNDILYFFTVASQDSNQNTIQVGCSFFKKHDRDYARGAAKTTLLLIEKITNLKQHTTIPLFKNPNYK